MLAQLACPDRRFEPEQAAGLGNVKERGPGVFAVQPWFAHRGRVLGPVFPDQVQRIQVGEVVPRGQVEALKTRRRVGELVFAGQARRPGDVGVGDPGSQPVLLAPAGAVPKDR